MKAMAQELEQQIAGVARRRRSIRKYKDEQIPRERLLEILSLAGRAPSAWNLQPWRFTVVEDREQKQRLQEAAFNQPQVGAAAAVIVLSSDMKDTLARLDELISPDMPAEARQKTKASVTGSFAKMGEAATEAWGRHQANIALGYLLLMLEVYGYGSSPMLGFNAEAVKKLLSLPDHAEVAALVAVGVPADPGRASYRLGIDQITRFV